MPRQNWPWIGGFAVAALLPLLAATPYSQVLLNMAVVNAINALGLYVIFGLTGILSVAQAAFWGLGAYAAALLSTDAGLPVFVGFLAGPALAALAGVLLGLPTLKLKSHYLTLATIGFAEVVRLVLMNWESVTHGPTGVREIPAPTLPGGLELASPRLYFYLSLALLLLAVVAVQRLRHSRLGRGLEAVRDDELAAAATGVSTTGLKVLAFAFAAALSGLSGALYAHLQRYISPDAFGLDHTIQFLAMLMIGGRRSVPGAILGAVLLTYLPEGLRFLQDWYMAIYGAGLLLILIFVPDGLAGALGRLGRYIRTVWGGAGQWAAPGK